MSADITAGPATGATSIAFPRHEQTVSDADASRNRAHAPVRELRTYKDGEALFETGKLGPGMFVVLSGHVAITQRDGLGHVTPVIDQGPGQFLAEIGQLSGRVALVDGHAEGDVETLLIPPERLRALLVAEADLGERIMRALILRRVSLIQGGVGGPVLIGPASLGDMARLQGFLTRNGQPHHLLDPGNRQGRRRSDRALFAIARAIWPLVVLPDGTVLRNPPETSTRLALGMIGGHAARQALRRRGRRLRSGRSCHRGLCGVGRIVGRGVRRALFRRPGRRQRAASKTIWAFRPASPARRWPAAPSPRRRSSAPTCMIPVAVEVARLRAHRRRLCAGDSMADDTLRARSIVVASGARYRRPEIETSTTFEGRGVWYWASPIEAQLCAEPGCRAGRRRQFRRAGRGVSVGPCPQGST